MFRADNDHLASFVATVRRDWRRAFHGPRDLAPVCGTASDADGSSDRI
jgi:hypothetical protein